MYLRECLTCPLAMDRNNNHTRHEISYIYTELQHHQAVEFFENPTQIYTKLCFPW